VTDVRELLAGYQARDQAEAADLARCRELAVAAADPWARSGPLHFTASALIVHPPTGRVLLRWHARHQAWMQVGGHGDAGESDPVAIALREGKEETGLADLAPWPDAALLHLAVVGVPARGAEAAHEHADLRFVLATGDPEAARAESPDTPVRWLDRAAARAAVQEDNLRETLARLDALMSGRERAAALREAALREAAPGQAALGQAALGQAAPGHLPGII
jgi:8-oxo-dGTP pyrophosphatase MutT (NUDIX family)